MNNMERSNGMAYMIKVILVFGSCSLMRGRELRYYTSREGATRCLADGMSPYRGYMKQLFCTNNHAGKICENDKFCTRPNERCICNNQCMEKRCITPGLGRQPLCIHGVIKDGNCTCNPGWKGKACDQDVNECKLNECNNNGTSNCVNTKGGYNCTCKTGWKGKNCDEDIDDCYPNPCKNSAHCKDQVGWYVCICINGFVGKQCSIKCPDCQGNSTCHLNHTNHAYCQCAQGMTGPKCEQDRDECKAHHTLCNNGKCINKGGSYECHCNKGWEGQYCSQKIDYCASQPCKHGQCITEPTYFTCKCLKNYTGTLCDKLINSCEDVTCLNGGTCQNLSLTRFKCNCAPGFNGTLCEHELPCYRTPCKNNATCWNDGDQFHCRCKPGWTGTDCSKQRSCKIGLCKNGGECIEGVGGTYTCKCLNGFRGKHCEEVMEKKCQNPNCSQHVGNCRKECNNHECNWDGTECSLGVSPWQRCIGTECWKKFGNGHCDVECNNDLCSFDGHDCEAVHKNCSYEEYCKKSYGNGHCESKCNTPECGYDDDCESTPDLVPGKLFVTLKSTKEEFEKRKQEFARSMGMLLNARVIIENVIEVDADEYGEAVRKRRSAYAGQKRLKIEMKLDNQNCKMNCFRSTKSAARYLAATKAKGKLGHLPFTVLGVSSKPDHGPIPGTISPLWIACCVAVPLLLLGVIAFTRKVVARLWHPEGDNRFPVNDMRREPLGQEGDEMTNLQRRESVSGGSHVSPSGSCSDSPNSVGDAKRMKVEMVGSLGSNDWLNVKGVLREQADASDGVVHIPAGSFEATHADSCGDTDGETNLHVAARLAKTELARQLIDFGVDINARNKSGKTPLHLAVSSLADGVFQLLIRNRACQIDIQDYEGRTSLMNACHCCHNMMVDELISNGAKVNLVDSQGKTALHCAAMVDNHKAVLVLLKNGAKVDSQDNKGQTPLFLAARDGAYTTAYVLLANYANRNCADSMDVTPLTISHQRGQKDLVALLSDWTGSPPGLMTSPSRNSPPDLSSPSSGTISPTPGSQYSDIRPKLPNNFGQINNGHCNNPIKPPMKRKRKPPKNAKEKPAIEKNHPSFLNNYPTSMNDLYPTPRSSMDKRDGPLPDLNSAEILEGMNAIYPPLDQINSLPTNWSSPIMGGGHGHYPYNNAMVPNNRQFQFPQQTFFNHPRDSCASGRTFPTPPSVDVESPNDIGSPIDQINVLPSPFLTPSPEAWSNSPGNSDNSAC